PGGERGAEEDEHDRDQPLDGAEGHLLDDPSAEVGTGEGGEAGGGDEQLHALLAEAGPGGAAPQRREPKDVDGEAGEVDEGGDDGGGPDELVPREPGAHEEGRAERSLHPGEPAEEPRERSADREHRRGEAEPLEPGGKLEGGKERDQR